MDRKEIVKRLGEYLGIKPKYLGAPSFAYQVGDYTVGRDGKIINESGDEVNLEAIISNNLETTDLEIALPMKDYTGSTLKNLVNMIYSRQFLIKKALGVEDNFVEEYFISAINNIDFETTKDFLYILEELGRENCKGISFNEDTITFIIKKQGLVPEEIGEIAKFFSLLNNTAKQLKYASAKPINTDNEKYAFRTWLIRLGMTGNEYKSTRKLLLQNLSGNGAFRKPGEGYEA